MDIGKRIRDLRLNAGIKQVSLGEMVGVSGAFISAIENNKKSPSMDTLLLICKAIGITPSEFFAGMDSTETNRDSVSCLSNEQEPANKLYQNDGGEIVAGSASAEEMDRWRTLAEEELDRRIQKAVQKELDKRGK